MNREHNYDAFIRWAEKQRDRNLNRPCIFCGYPTRSESQTCPAHRDLAPPIEDLIFDSVEGPDVPSPGDTDSRVGGAGVATDLASRPADDPRPVDRRSP